MTGPAVLVHRLFVGDLREHSSMLPVAVDVRDLAQYPPRDDRNDERCGSEHPPFEIFAERLAEVPARAILGHERNPLPILRELADELVEIHGAIVSGPRPRRQIEPSCLRGAAINRAYDLPQNRIVIGEAQRARSGSPRSTRSSLGAGGPARSCV